MDGVSMLSSSRVRPADNNYDSLRIPSFRAHRFLLNRLLVSSGSSQGWKMPSIFRKDSFRWLVPRTSERRLVCKSGECKISRVNIDKRSRRFLADIFTTMVDIQWRWNLLIFTLAFTLSWIIFALAWWLVAFSHQDLEHYGTPGWKPCVEEVYDFATALLFSIETQQTIGYGNRCMNPDCPHAIALVMFQSCFGIITQALMTGLVFAKLSRPKKRAQTLMFSKRAVICPRDGQLNLLFRVGDMRKSHIVEAHVRVLLVSKRVTGEGEVLPVYQRELTLGEGDDDEGRLFLVWPVVVQHHITDTSPLWDVSADDLTDGRKHFEIIVILEGIVESTGMTTQARTSYLPNEILWGHRFERLVRYRRENGMYEVDYARFHQTVPITEAAVSRDSAQQQAAGRGNDVDDDLTSSDDDTHEHAEEPASDQRLRTKRRKLKVPPESGSVSPSPAAGVRDPGDDDGATSTLSGSPPNAALATHMLQLAVGRSPVRLRRSCSPVLPHRHLTDASLAAFDLSPELEDMSNSAATASLYTGDLMDTVNFALAPYDLQT